MIKIWGLKKIIKSTLSGIGLIALFLLFSQNANAAAVSISCAANPTIVQGVDFQTTDDVTLTTSGTCTLTTDQTEGGADAYVSMASLTINTGVTLTHAVSGTTASHHNELDLHLTGDLTISGTGSINVAGKGYNGGLATGYGYTNGNTTGLGVSSRIYAGGSHGGRGGYYSATYYPATAYDSIVSPTLPGGGGGGNNGTTQRGMNGGGVVIITATNVTVNGSINANGETFASSYYGGGAGGTISINASGTLSGTGSVTANGTYNTTSNYPGGGGGRIALYCGTDSNSFSSLLAAGGNPSGANYDGAAGTIYKKITANTYGSLLLDNNSNAQAYYTTSIDSTNDDSFSTVTIKNKATLTIDSSASAFTMVDLDVQANSALDSNLTSALTPTSITTGSAATADFAGDVTVTTYTDSGGTNILQGALSVTNMTATGTVTVTGAMTVATGYTTTGATTTVSGTLTMPAFFSGTPTGTLTTNGTAYIATGTVTIPSGMTWNANSTLQKSSGVNLTAMTIQSGGTLSHTVASTVADTYNQLNFTIDGDLTIDTGGSINVSGKGYNGGGATGYGYTNGNTNASTSGSYIYQGGSHGGKGGHYHATYRVAEAYDSIIDPALPGGGGGGNNDTTMRGMNGGGVARITATNVTVNGSINANGETFASSYYGGGAGGSIYVNASGTLSGTGSVTASGTYKTSATNYGGGGGGRIALYYGTDSSSFSSILAAGGNSTSANSDGAAGTIFKKRTSDTNGHLIIDNNGAAQDYYKTIIDSTIDQTFDDVVIKNNADLNIASTATAFSTPVLDVQASSTFESDLTSELTFTTITVGSAASVDFAGDVVVTTYTDSGGTNIFQGNLTVTTMSATGTVTVTGNMTVLTSYTDSGSTLTVTGILTMPSFFSGTPTGTFTTNGTAYISSGTVTIPSGMTWVVNGTIQQSSGVNLTSMTIQSGGVLTHSLASTTGGTYNQLNLTIDGDLTIDVGGSINVSGKGYNGGGATGYGYTNGNTATGGSYLYSGGSHGGKGGRNSTYQVAEAYDSIVNPVLPGGGGGGNNDTTQRGMHGGGVARITATNVTVNGSINANGETFASSYAGGGAGGTIYINVSNTLSGTGSLSANGTYNSTSNLGAGAGGRIALYYGTDDSTFSSIIAAGGNSATASNDGAAGTIYKKAATDTYGSLTVDNNSNTSPYYTTPMDSTNDDSFSTVTIKNRATLTINSSAAAFTMVDLDVQANSSLDSNLASGTTLTSITTGSSATSDFAGDVTVSTYTDSGGTNILQGALAVTTMSATGTVTVTGAMTVATSYISTGATTTVTGTLTMPAFFSGTPTGTLTTNGTAYIATGTVTIPSGMTWNANSTIQKSSGVNLTAMTIQSGGTLSHTVASTVADTYNQLSFTINGDLTIDTGGSINVAGKGYNGGASSGSTYGYTNGNTSTGGSYVYAGGSHGGRGGHTSSYTIAGAYDSIVDPALPGGGGGGASSAPGIKGGGVARIIATNITVNGSINANGETFSGTMGGGGAGGSIYLNVSNTLSGTGSITANGTYNSTSNLGAGGGGRIALYYTTDSSTFSTLLAAGGDSGAASADGAAGTVFKKSASDTYGHLILDNNSANSTYYKTLIDSTIDQTFDDIIIKNKAALNVDTTGTAFSTPVLDVQASSILDCDVTSELTITTLTVRSAASVDFAGDLVVTTYTDSSGTNTLQGALTVTNMTATGTVTVTGAMTVGTGYTSTGATTTVTGTLTMPDFFSGTPTGTLTTNGTAYIDSGTVTIPNGMTWYANSTIQKSSGVNLTAMTIQNGGTLSHTVASTVGGTYNQLNFTVNGDLTIDTGGSINVAGKGYNGGASSSNSTGYTSGNTTTGGSNTYAGGSHGGRGGHTSTYTIAEAYDSIVNPTLPGGGGGGHTSAPGIKGGGVARITATNVTVNGSINANGETFSGTMGGGGAGGSIYVNASGTLSGTGSLSANGTYNSTSNLGAGGGGRIALYYGTDSSTFSSLLAAGGNSGNANADGAAGTIYKKASASSFGDLIINDNTVNSAYYTTSLLTTIPASDQIQNSGYAFASVTVSNYGILNVPSAVDSTGDGTTPGGYIRKFYCSSCAADNNTLSDGEIVYNKLLISDGATSNYTCVATTTPGVTITESGTTDVTEGGATDTYQIKLDALPSADVTITPTCSSTSYGCTVSPATLTYTSANGTTNQTVTVTATNDTRYEGAHTATITHAASSSDGLYNGFTIASITANITDDDSQPTVSLGINNATISETGGSATVTATLSNSSVEAVTVNLAYTGTATAGTDYTKSDSIVISAGSTSNTATITATSDTTDEVDETSIVDISGVTNGTESGSQQVTTTITDDDEAPALSIDDVSLSEGNAGSANATFTVTLSAASGQAISVAYATSNNTATATADYTATSGTLNFSAGETSKTINVPVLGDVQDEANETYTVTLSSPTNATISDATGTGTITDDDATPTVTLSRNNATLAENGGTSTVTATLSAASGRDITVNLGFTGTATNTTDYTSSAAIVITAGNTSNTMTLTGVDDGASDADETIIVDISSVTNGTEAVPQQVTVTITDDDGAQPTVTLAIDTTPIAENASVATATATLSGTHSQDVTINFDYTGTATSGGLDYTASASNCIVTAGGTTCNVTFTSVVDALDEADETIIIDISSVTNGTESGTQQQTVTITDDDATPTVTLGVDTTPIAEDASVATATATLSAASGRNVTVNFGYTGTATSGGTDYSASANNCIITAGDTTCNATFTSVVDTLDEADETIIIDISSVTNGTEAVPQQQTVTITDDDATPTVTLGIDTTPIAEDASVSTATATLSAASGRNVTVNFAYTGTATGGATDYTASADNCVVTAGNTTCNVTFTSVVDALDETDETIIIDISSVTNGTESGTQQQTVTITDDDATPTVTLGVDTTPIAEDASVSTATATLSAASGINVTVNFGYTGTASGAGVDYTASANNCIVTAGATTCTVTITSVVDTLDETDETVIIDISSVTNGTESGSQQQTVTITDNDAAPTVTLGLSGSPLAENGGAATVTATLSTASGKSVTVDLGYAGTATNISDYTRSGTSIIIAAGDTEGTVTITGVNDALNETGETVILDITGVTNGTESGSQQVTATITDDDATPSVSFTSASQSGSEGGVAMTITAQLSAASGQNVTLPYTITGTASGSGTDYNITASPIEITAGATTQTITVTPVEDGSDEPDETVIVTMGNPTNATKGATTVHTVTLTDNDNGPPIANAGSDQTPNESAGSASLDGTASSDPEAQSLTYLWTETADASNACSLSSTTASQPTVTLADKATDYTCTYSLVVNDGTTDSALDSMTISVTANNDTPTANNQTLTTPSEIPTGIILTGNDPEGTSLTFATVTGPTHGNLSGFDTNTGAITYTPEPDYFGSDSFTFTVSDGNSTSTQATVTLNIPGILITESGDQTDLTEGGDTDSITVILASQPTDDVSVAISTDANSSSDQATLFFTADDWNEPQTITITATDNHIIDGGHTSDIDFLSTSDDPNYDNISSNVVANITDNDSAGVSLVQSGGATIISEAGTTDSYTLALTSVPASDVVINISAEDNCNVSSSLITFTNINWADPQTITVSSINDSIAQGAHVCLITHTSLSSDGTYNGLEIPSVTTLISDNDSTGITLTELDGSTTITEAGQTDSYTLVLTSEPTDTVNITLHPGAGITTTPSAIVFNASNWNSPQTITVSYNDSSLVSESITHSVTSNDNAYNNYSLPVVSVGITLTSDDSSDDNTEDNTDNSDEDSQAGGGEEAEPILNAEAGSNKTVTLGTRVRLNASSSTGVNRVYNWEIVQGTGSLATIDGNLTSKALSSEGNPYIDYLPETAGVHIIALTVTDGNGLSDTDTVRITTVNNNTLEMSGTSRTVVLTIPGTNIVITQRTEGNTIILECSAFSISIPLGDNATSSYRLALAQEGNDTYLLIYLSETNDVYIASLEDLSAATGTLDLSSSSARAQQNTFEVIADILTSTSDAISFQSSGGRLLLSVTHNGSQNSSVDLYENPTPGDSAFIFQNSFLISNNNGTGIYEFNSYGDWDILGPPIPDSLTYQAPASYNVTSLQMYQMPDTLTEINIDEPDIVINCGCHGISSYDLGDINGDGNTDLILSTEEGNIYIFYNFVELTGSISIEEADVTLQTGEDLTGAHIVVTDLTNDGLADIIIGLPLTGDNEEGSVALFFGSSDLSGVVDFNNSDQTLFIYGNQTLGKIGTAILTQDADSDGNVEIYTVNASGDTYNIDMAQGMQTPEEETGYSLKSNSIAGCQLNKSNANKLDFLICLFPLYLFISLARHSHRLSK